MFVCAFEILAALGLLGQTSQFTSYITFPNFHNLILLYFYNKPLSIHALTVICSSIILKTLNKHPPHTAPLKTISAEPHTFYKHQGLIEKMHASIVIFFSKTNSFLTWHLSGCALALDFSQEKDFPQSILHLADFSSP
jgi:hypothetical protein